MRKDDHNPYAERPRNPGRAVLTALILALVAVLVYWKWSDIAALFTPGDIVEQVETVDTEETAEAGWGEPQGIEVPEDDDIAAILAELYESDPDLNPDPEPAAPEVVQEAAPEPWPAAVPAVETGPRRMRVEAFRENDKVGIRNMDSGEVLIEPQYEREAYRGTDPVWFVVVMKGGKYGIVSLDNEVLLPFEYDYIKDIPYTESYMTLLKTSPMKHGMVRTKDMKVVIPMEYDGMSVNWPFIAVGRGGVWGTVDVDNKEVVPIDHPGSPGFTSQGGKYTEVWFRNAEGNIVSYDINGKIVGIE